jgi:hypothetical protein
MSLDLLRDYNKEAGIRVDFVGLDGHTLCGRRVG